MATLCGHHRYRAIARFARVHEATLRRAFAIKTVPSHVTLTSVLARLDAHALARALEAFVAPRALAGTPVAIDGKAIRASMHHHGETEQDFAAVASAFTHRIGPRSGHRSGSSSGGGLVIASEPYHNAHTSEIDAVEALIARLGSAGTLQGRTGTLDALHAQKKRSLQSSPPARTT